MSLLLLLAMVILWVRSYEVSDTIRHVSAGHRRGLESSHGTIRVCRIDARRDRPYGDMGWCFETESHRLVSYGMSGIYLSTSDRSFRYMPLGIERIDGSARGQQFTVFIIPMAWLAVLSSALPAWWCAGTGVGALRRWRRRAAAVLCRNCGYDLRATPDRCPECGTIPAR